jgi:nucleoside-diphosphate-sugar epimerase
MNRDVDVLILGCGYTGRRVARRFLERGVSVIPTSRAVPLEQVAGELRPGTLVLHSIPPAGKPDLRLLRDFAVRLVYLSSTAVYGPAAFVDENTPADPSGERARARLEAERQAADGPWSTLILRPAAMYGPGRGAHVSLARGEYRVGDNLISRIHVEDLAAHAEAGLLSDLTGAYPVADEEPCTSREMAAFCARLLGSPPPQAGGPGRVTSDRRVDGSAIRRALGITLQYPSYRTGIPAALGL